MAMAAAMKRGHYNTCLIFTYIGIAKLVSESRHDIQQVSWVLPPGISQSQLGGVFKLDWLHRLV